LIGAFRHLIIAFQMTLRNVGEAVVSPSRYRRSAELHAEAKRWLAGGVNSNFRLGGTPQPLFFSGASGALVHDVDGNEYVDYVLGMGPAILGHTPEAVRRSVIAALQGGQLYGGQNEAEIALSRRICELVPAAERVRFSTSGSEAVQAATRLARAATGRRKLLKFEGHYHGWFDGELVSVHPPLEEAGPADSPRAVAGSAGQPEPVAADMLVARWNDVEHLERVLDEHGASIAAVLMEPILCNTAVVSPRPGYLERVRELCDQCGALLVFDEVITGFRVDLGGAQALLGVTPDLACFAKALGGGFPVSCVAGRADVMDLAESSVVHGGTYNAQAAGVAAALATMEALSADEALAGVRKTGEALMEGIRAIAAELAVPLVVQGLGSVFHTNFGHTEATDYRTYVEGFDLPRMGRFIRALQDRGVRITLRGTWFVSTEHGEAEVERTLRAVESALADMQDGVDALAPD
jgi:glutamate-1-semialdehyde 2,1-aminomutase